MKFIKIAAIIFSLHAASVNAEVLLPKTGADFKKATVKITDSTGVTGGSGSIVKSTPTGSYILTNRHICALIQEHNGVLVHTHKGSFQAERYKASKVHDLCLIEVVADLGVNLTFAKQAPAFGSKTVVSGHPLLFPNMITEGAASDNMQVQLLIEVRKCAGKQWDNNTFACLMLGGIPVIKNFEAQAISSIIAPGSSGSSVYNDKGEIIGVVFAGYGRGYCQGLIVPHAYVRAFYSEELKKLKWVSANSEKELEEEATESKMLTTIDKNTLRNIMVPAIKSDNMIKFSEKIEACILESAACNTK